MTRKEPMAVLEEEAERVRDTLTRAVAREALDRLSRSLLPARLLDMSAGGVSLLLATPPASTVLPVVDRGVEVRLDLVRLLVDADDPDATVARFRDTLLESNLLWRMADGPTEREEALAGDIIAIDRAVTEPMAAMVRDADGRYADITGLARRTGMTRDELLAIYEEGFALPDLVERHRGILHSGEIVPGVRGSRREAFLDILVAGLREGGESVLSRIEDRWPD